MLAAQRLQPTAFYIRKKIFSITLLILFYHSSFNRLKNEVNPKTGLPIFGFATSISLLLFYAFSLQCMSTVAVTYKETKSLKWTSVQFIYMTALAYFSALIAFQLLS